MLTLYFFPPFDLSATPRQALKVESTEQTKDENSKPNETKPKTDVSQKRKT